MISEQIYPGFDNTIKWVVSRRETPTGPSRVFDMDANNITKVAVSVDGDLKTSDADNVNFSTSMVTMQLGLDFPVLAAGRYPGKLILYSADFPGGKVWEDEVEFVVK